MGTSTADRIRERRLAADLTQEQLAVRAGVTAKTLANAEKEKGYTPHRGTLYLIAHALGCEVADLTGMPEEAAA